jgi:hypothetical protein
MHRRQLTQETPGIFNDDVHPGRPRFRAKCRLADGLRTDGRASKIASSLPE